MSVEKFKEVFKSYGENIANKELYKLLKTGTCAVIKQKEMPMI